MNLWITDPVTNQKSVTLTLFVAGFVVALLKLTLSGVDIGSLKVVAFTGGDFAAVVGSLGGIYALRRYSDQKGNSNDTEQNK